MAKYLDMTGVSYLLVRVRQIVEDVTSGALDLTDYVTKTQLQKELNSLNINVDLSSYVTIEDLTTALQSYVKPSALSAYVKTSTLASYAKTEDLEGLVHEADLNGYATETFVTNAINNAQLSGDGTSIDLSIYATTESMNSALANKADKTHTHNNYATTDYVDEAIENIDLSGADIDLTNYYTKKETDNAITAAQPDLSDFATEAYVNEKIDTVEEAINNIEVSGAEVYYGSSEPTDGQEIWINPNGVIENYATIAYVDEAISNIDTSEVNLEGYAKTVDVNASLAKKANVDHDHEEYLTEHQDISGKADKIHTHKMSDITDYTVPSVDLSGYYTKTQVDTKIAEAQLDGGEVDLSGYATKSYVQEQIDGLDLEVTVDGIGKAGTGRGAETFNHNSSFDSENAAYGIYSHAEGYHTSATGDFQHVQGKYNIEDTSNKYAHIVGNGDSSARKNAHTLDWHGNAWFAGKVYVGGTSMDDAVELGVNTGSVDLTNYYNKEETNALIPSDDYINSLIDNKLGVIENGTY